MEHIERIKSMKSREKIVMLTAYDYCNAKILDSSGIDIILVGDSLGMVVLGYKSTREVTMEDMLRHTKAVANGSKNTLIVADLPYNSDITPDDVVRNARLLLANGAGAVKPEGKPEIAKALTKSGINVMGHAGLLPQTTREYLVQGRDSASAKEIFNMTIALENAGCFAIVLECIPSELAKKITEKLKIPTIGIGAGKYCDGQVLVINDMLGMYDEIKPKFVKRYGNISRAIKESILRYKKDVKDGNFPDDTHSYY